MFLAWCDTKDQNVLIGPSYIQGLTNTEQGMTLSYICDCGELGQMVTGAATAQVVSGHTTPITPASEAPTAA